MKVFQSTIEKLLYILLLLVLTATIAISVIVVSLYQQSRQGKRFTYCDGLYVYSQLQHKPYTDLTCNNDTKFQNHIKSIR